MSPPRDQVFPQPDDWVAKARQIQEEWEAEKGSRLTPMQRKFLRAHVSGRADYYIPPKNPLDHPRPDEDSPALYFFYGTLMDPEWLAEIAGFDSPPEMLDATLQLYHIKFWGPYPVLVMDNLKTSQVMGEVKGKVCLLPTVDAVRKARDYETKHYIENIVEVSLEGEKRRKCRTFMWHNASEVQYLTDEPTEDPQPPLGWD